MSPDATKLRFPVAAVAALLSIAVTGAGAWAVAAERLNDNRTRTEKLEATSADQRLRTQRVEDGLSEIRDMLREVRSDVKDLKRR